MTRNGFSLLGGLLKSSGLGTMAAALAMMALPAEAFAQDRGVGHRWRNGGSPQTQTQNSGGGWRGNSSAQTQRSSQGGGWNRGSSAQAPRGNSAPQRSWNRGNNGSGTSVQAPRPNRRSWTGTGQGMTRVNPDAAARSRGEEAVQTRRGSRERSWQGGSRSWQGNPDTATVQRGRTRRESRERSWQGNRGTETVQRERTRRDDGWRSRNDGNRNWSHGDNNWRSRDRDWNNRGERWRDKRWRDSNRNWRDGHRSWRDNDRHRYSNDHRRWDRNWRSNNRYDWRHYRARNHHIYRIGRYYSPYHNHYYSRLNVGFFLDSLFYSSRYWIDDPWSYRLPPADGPYRWIRYYDDALLVDIYTGEVIDVIYDFFW